MKRFLMMVLFINIAFACPVEQHEFMLAGMKSFSQSESQSGITKEDFEQVLTRVRDHYEKAWLSEKRREVVDFRGRRRLFCLP